MNRLKKILWIADKYIDTSIDRATWIETVKHLVHMGYDITLLTLARKRKLYYGIRPHIHYMAYLRIRYLGFFTFYLFLIFYLGYYLFIKRKEVVILHPASCLAALPFVLLRKIGLLKTRWILDIRTIPVEQSGFTAQLNRRIFHSAVTIARLFFDSITVITPFMREWLSKTYGLNGKKIGIWTSGVSIETFNPENCDQDALVHLRKTFGLVNKFVIMYHGILKIERGLQETLKALKIFVNNGHPDCVLFLLGDGADRYKLKKLIHSYRLDGHVIIHGPVPYEQVPVFLMASDVGILPFPFVDCWRVSSPIKLMEYLAMGKPVIVTEMEAHRHVIGDHAAGFFVKSNHPEELIKGISESYLKRKYLPILGEMGRDIVAQRYTWEKQALELSHYFGS